MTFGRPPVRKIKKPGHMVLRTVEVSNDFLFFFCLGAIPWGYSEVPPDSALKDHFWGALGITGFQG